MSFKVALIGAGSREFASQMIRDLLLSEPIADAHLEIALMDIAPAALPEVEQYTRELIDQLHHPASVWSTTELVPAVADADYVITAIERDRYRYWSQDFKIPRSFGFKQIFGENGGPGGLFHALRQFIPLHEIARAVETHAPDALILNFSNPEQKVCEMISRLTSAKSAGLCGGFVGGRDQVSRILGVPVERLDIVACGVNHFTWFQSIRDRETGEDLYPLLREREREGDWASEWHDIGLSRIAFRRFGLWPSPGSNHIGEYLSWAEDYVPSQLQFFFDPMTEKPWAEGGRVPEWYYDIGRADTRRPFGRRADTPPALVSLRDQPLEKSHEFAIPIMESRTFGVEHSLPAVNVPNRGSMPGMSDETVVEVPVVVESGELVGQRLERLPEGILAMVRLQGSIQQLLVEAYAEQSKDKLLQAILIDPVVDSHDRAVAMLETFLSLQQTALPPLR